MEELARTSFRIHVVESHDALVKFEEVNLVWLAALIITLLRQVLGGPVVGVVVLYFVKRSIEAASVLDTLRLGSHRDLHV